MTRDKLTRASHEGVCLAVDDKERRSVMLALFSNGKMGALLALSPKGARSLAEDLIKAADEQLK